MSKSPHPFAFSNEPKRRLVGWARRNAIGIVSPSYGTEKVSYGLQPKGYTFDRVQRVPFHRLERRGSFWGQTPLLLDHPVELVHSFNELPVGIRPFVVSFESELPRYLGDPPDWQLEFGYRLLASARCRRILALSEAAAAALTRRLEARGLDPLSPKICVFRGAIPALSRSELPRQQPLKSQRALKVLFVGRDSFRKGLIPTLDALDMCRAQGANIEATVVSEGRGMDYTKKDRVVEGGDVLQRVAQMPWVTHHFRLPNSMIHELMRSHDVLVFPTLDESLGWVAIEAALAGMAVITTDTFALPELVVHNETGFLISLEKGIDRRWVGLWLEGFPLDDAIAVAFEQIRLELVRHLLYLVDKPELVTAMGEAGRVRIQSMYGLDAARREISGIYASALGR